MTESKLDLILHKTEYNKFQMFACRGEGKGCKRNRFLKRKKPCRDCVGPLDEKLTIGEVQRILKRGDA